MPAGNGYKGECSLPKVNDKVITPQNMQSLVTELQSNSSAVLRLAALNSDGTALIDSARVAVQSGYVDDKCVYATKLFEKQGIKTGYLAYFYVPNRKMYCCWKRFRN